MKQLAARCRMVSAPAGALLNGSCEVVSLEGDKFVLGFYYPVHMGRILNEFKSLVEAQAAEILGRPMTLEAQQMERNGRPQRKAPKGGHLVEAARAIGATPIGKEQD